MIKKSFILQLFLAFPLLALAQNVLDKQSNPRAIRLITEDITRFWAAFDSSRVNPTHSEEIFKTLYFDKGTPGLREFDIQSIKGIKNLALAAKKYELYYNSIRSNTLKVERTKEKIVKSLIRFKKLYEPAKFPSVYFLIGDLNSGGRSSEEGLLIGTEVNCADNKSDFTNIYPPFVPILKSLTVKNIPNIVVHELMHYQQAYADQHLNLLGNIIREGSADFLSELITRQTNNVQLRAYGDKYERELWNELKNELTSSEIKKWLYNSTVDERPANIGYYIGYKITQSYYNNSANKKQAISDILNIKDFREFLIKSQYQEKFN